MSNTKALLIPAIWAIFTFACGTAATIAPTASAIPTITPTTASAPAANVTPVPNVVSTSEPSRQTPSIAPATPPKPPATTQPLPTTQPPKALPSGAREVTLTAAEIRGLNHLGIRSAMADLAQRAVPAGHELAGVSIISAQLVTWPDASLGCPEPGTS